MIRFYFLFHWISQSSLEIAPFTHLIFPQMSPLTSRKLPVCAIERSRSRIRQNKEVVLSIPAERINGEAKNNEKRHCLAMRKPHTLNFKCQNFASAP